MRARLKRTKLLRLLIISYIVVLCFPLVFSHILYIRTMRVTEENVRAMSESSLARTEDSIARVLTDLSATARELTTREQTQSLLFATRPLMPVKLEKIRALQDELRLRVTHSQYIDQVDMYFPQPQVVASSREYQSSLESFERVLGDQLGISFSDFNAITQEGGDFSLHLLGGQKLVAIARSLMYADEPGVITLFTLRTERLRALLDSHADQHAYSLLWMVSPSGDVFSNRATMQLGGTLEMDAAGLYSAVLDGTVPKEAILTSGQVGDSGWQLYSAVSAAQYSQPLKSIQLAYVVYLLICLAIGLVFSLLFAHRHYKPISRLSQLLKIKPEGQAEHGEYDALQHALLDLIEQERTQSSLMRQQQRQLRDSALRRMLLGQVTSEPLFRAICQEHGLTLSADRFLCVGITMREAGRFFDEDDDQREQEDESLLRFLVASVLEELLQAEADAYAFSSSDQVFAIVTPRTAEPAAAFESRIQSICLQSGEFIHARTGILLTHYVTSLYADSGDFTALYTAVKDVTWGMEQIEGFQLQDDLLTRPLLSAKNSALLEAVDAYELNLLRTQFLHEAMQGDEATALAHYRKLRYAGTILADSFLSVQFNTTLLLTQLIDSAFTPAQRQALRTQITDMTSRMRAARDMRELETAMGAAISWVSCHLRIADAEGGELATFDKVMAYIDLHYEDPQLSVSSLCDQFSISSSYLLKLFKRHGQSGVLDVIHQHRIDAAKRLLHTTDLSIAKIAEQIGYTSALALNRAFKRTEGVTPGSYRSPSPLH